ncbi:hypothetical protein [Kribbella kalugense]|uniref:Uncharacterized protein n=1 Tax=Kribbella kalugense TaxID=2512221 RepID=A0A4R8A1Z1_9ACTN|nr:hypothetical protein [Kribbella kalugense]TDW24442.1 hypothetical protein EV650_3321 [Kribbella kalugense]
MRRRCRYPAGTDPYAADLVRRLRGLLAIVLGPPVHGPGAVRRDDELLDQFAPDPLPGGDGRPSL